MAEHEKICGYCAKEFTASRSDAKFCSANCRASYAKAKATGQITISVSPEFDKIKERHINQAHTESKRDVFFEILEELRQIRVLLSSGNDRVLTIDQVLKEFEMSRPTFERLQAEGMIQVHRFGERASRGRGKKGYLLYSELLCALKKDSLK